MGVLCVFYVNLLSDKYIAIEALERNQHHFVDFVIGVDYFKYNLNHLIANQN